MKKRITALFLSVLLCSSFISCSNQNADQAEKQPDSAEINVSQDDIAVTEDEPEIQFGIPEEDNGGRDFHILVPTEKAYEFVTEVTGEVVNDSVYERSLKTEDYFKISFSYQYELGGWDTRDSYNNFVKNAVLAGDSTYDVATGYIVCTLPLYMQGSLADLMTIDDLNLDNPWWINDQYENLNLNGKLFCLLGDTNLSIYKDCSVVYFNKQIIEDFSLENPYTMVREGTWTMEKLMAMSETVLGDLDGNGEIDPEVDRVGIYGQHVPLRAFQSSLDIKVIDTDENGDRYVIGLTDRLAKAYETVNNFRNRKDFYAENGAVDFYQFCHILAENRALFHLSYLYIIEGDMMRNMESDFGIVPYPKLDESQEMYLTQIGTSSNVFFLPKTASDFGLSCRVYEALSYYSMIDVIPTYYTVALENKYTRDADVPEMLSLIRDGMTMDFAFALSTCFSGTWPNLIMTQENANMASFMKINQKMWTKTVEKLCEIEE